MLPRFILANPARGGRSHWCDTLNLVRARIRKWKADQIPDLWADVMTATDVHARRRKKTKKLPLEQLRKAMPDVQSAPSSMGSTGRPSKPYPPMVLPRLLPRSGTRCSPNIPGSSPNHPPGSNSDSSFPH